MWKPALLAFLAFQTIDRTHANFCSNVTVWRNNNLTCPSHAICADVFYTIRYVSKGKTCKEKKTIHNCLCESSEACPVDDPAHELYASLYHTFHTCQKKCNYPYCPYLQQLLLRPHYVMQAMTIELHSPYFHGLTYEEIFCRCPRHHKPSIGFGIIHSSVQSYDTHYDTRSRHNRVQLTCRSSECAIPLADPCDTVKDTEIKKYN